MISRRPVSPAPAFGRPNTSGPNTSRNKNSKAFQSDPPATIGIHHLHGNCYLSGAGDWDVTLVEARLAEHMCDNKRRLTNSVEAIEAMEAEAQLPQSLQERSHRLALACRAAAAIARDRRRAGLPEPTPEPWPASTWEFLAKHARSQAKTSG